MAHFGVIPRRYLNVLNSCESSCRGGTLNDENVLTKYTALFTTIWLIFGAIQLRYGEKTGMSPHPRPLSPGRGGFSNSFSGMLRHSQTDVGRPKQWHGMPRVRRTFRRRCRAADLRMPPRTGSGHREGCSVPAGGERGENGLKTRSSATGIPFRLELSRQRRSRATARRAVLASSMADRQRR